MMYFIKNKPLILICLSTLIVLGSCKKDERWIPNDNLHLFDMSKLFLKYTQSDSSAEYFISGDFDGTHICCASTYSEWYPIHDTTFNALYFDEKRGLDEIMMQRETADMRFFIYISISQLHLRIVKLPHTVIHSPMFTEESAVLHVLNSTHITRRGQKLPDEDCEFIGGTYNDLIDMHINSFVGNVIEGTFEGRIKSKNNSTITVRNGRFRLKLFLIDTAKE